jgi:hypothetical protein
MLDQEKLLEAARSKLAEEMLNALPKSERDAILVDGIKASIKKISDSWII